MNDIDPAKRFPPEAARELQASPAGERPSVLNEMARQVASQLGNDTVTPVMVSGTLRILEFAALTLSGLVVYWFLVGPFDLSEWQYYIVIAAGSAIAVAFLEFSDCYQVAALMRPFATFSRILLIWAGTFALMALTAFMLKVGADFSRLMFGVWFVTGFASSFTLRLIVARLIRRWARNGRMERRAVIVGGGKAPGDHIRAIEEQPNNDIRI